MMGAERAGTGDAPRYPLPRYFSLTLRGYFSHFFEELLWLASPEGTVPLPV
jgi:hypothetical protein